MWRGDGKDNDIRFKLKSFKATGHEFFVDFNVTARRRRGDGVETARRRRGDGVEFDDIPSKF